MLSKLLSRLTLSSGFKRHLRVRIKRSCLCIYIKIVSKEFSLQFSRKCMTPSKRSGVLSLSCGGLETSSRVISPSGSESSLPRKLRFPSGSEKFFRESHNSLRGAYNAGFILERDLAEFSTVRKKNAP